MFRRILLASLVAGLVAGICLTGVQLLGVIPLIAEAETYESGAAAASIQPAAHDQGHAHAHHRDHWSPSLGLERTAWTAASNVLIAIGFALILGAVFAWRGNPTWRQGLLWGAAGFVVFFANPAIGLHPELPGTFAAELVDRQLWWLFAVVCSAAGVGLLLLARRPAARLAGIALLVLPHALGAPHPEVAGGLAPPALARDFAIATTTANGLFWLILGLTTALAFRRLARR